MKALLGSAAVDVWNRQSLARQLFLAMFSAVVVVTSALLLYDLQLNSRRLSAMERSTMQAIFPVIERIITDAMLHKSRERVRHLFASASSAGVAESMYLLDATRHAVNVDDLAAGRAPRRFTPSEVPGPTHLIMDFPLRAEPACLRCHTSASGVLGYIRVVSPHVEKARILAQTFRSHALLFFLVALLVGAWALLVVRLMVDRPLGKIVRAMARVRAGRLDTRLPGPAQGEFGHLATGFNAMVQDLEQDRQEIVDLHRRQVAHMERLVAVGELAANLAHEIRNPLTGISGAIQVLQRDAGADERRQVVLEKILSQLSRMDQTMDNFLRYARMPETNVRTYDLGEALQRVFFLIEGRLKSQAIELRRGVEPGLPAVTGDPAQIEQAVLNLCLNSIQAMPQGGSLSVSARREGGEIRLDIADDGAGIASEQLERIFQPFFTTRENGSGLGLPISRQIILAHGGELRLESALGRGTTAHIRLPIEARGL